jgi:hypothetical protein
MDTRVKELNLLLLFLTGWEKDSTREPGMKVFHSWKGYLFKVHSELENEKLIHQIKNSKSGILSEQGLRKSS